MCVSNQIVIVVGFIFSVFYGVRAYFEDGYYKEKRKCIRNLNKIYVFVFHFLGSVIGWSFLWILFKDIDSLTQIEKSLENLILLIFGYLGVIGHIPQTLYGFVTSFGEITKLATNKINPVLENKMKELIKANKNK